MIPAASDDIFAPGITIDATAEIRAFICTVPWPALVGENGSAAADQNRARLCEICWRATRQCLFTPARSLIHHECVEVSIAIACSTVGIESRQREIFRKTILYCTLYVVAVGLLVWIGAVTRIPQAWTPRSLPIP